MKGRRGNDLDGHVAIVEVWYVLLDLSDVLWVFLVRKIFGLYISIL